MQRIVSGMRSTGRLHLGHYLGVIQNWVELQAYTNQNECFFFVADWHALTTKYDDTKNLKQDVTDVVIDWLSSGIDPEKSTIYVQSLIPEIAELNIYLSMTTPQNWVERDPTLKDMAKILHSKESNNAQFSYGLMGYPVLMSADIMMLNATAVPVGIDQVAHIEITRDIVRRFNNIYKTDYFNEPKPLLNECSLICGLDGNKMSKSYNNDIKISDSEEITAKKIMTAITDRSRIRRDDAGHPNDCEVAFKYWQVFGDEQSVQTVRSECEQGTRGCADCKRQLGCLVNEKLHEIREKRTYYENHINKVHEIIREGSEKTRKEAQKVITDVRNIIGMY